MVLTLDFFDSNNMPGAGTKYVIRKHLPLLVKNILQDL